MLWYGVFLIYRIVFWYWLYKQLELCLVRWITELLKRTLQDIINSTKDKNVWSKAGFPSKSFWRNIALFKTWSSQKILSVQWSKIFHVLICKQKWPLVHDSDVQILAFQTMRLDSYCCSLRLIPNHSMLSWQSRWVNFFGNFRRSFSKLIVKLEHNLIHTI